MKKQAALVTVVVFVAGVLVQLSRPVPNSSQAALDAAPLSLAPAGSVQAGLSAAASAGGWSWQNPLPQGNTVAVTTHLFGVSFVDAGTGTAVGGGGTILRTVDGGATWTPQSSGTTNFLFGVSFVDASTGTAVGGGGTIPQTEVFCCLFFCCG